MSAIEQRPLRSPKCAQLLTAPSVQTQQLPRHGGALRQRTRWRMRGTSGWRRPLQRVRWGCGPCGARWCPELLVVAVQCRRHCASPNRTMMVRHHALVGRGEHLCDAAQIRSQNRSQSRRRSRNRLPLQAVRRSSGTVARAAGCERRLHQLRQLHRLQQFEPLLPDATPMMCVELQRQQRQLAMHPRL